MRAKVSVSTRGLAGLVAVGVAIAVLGVGAANASVPRETSAVQATNAVQAAAAQVATTALSPNEVIWG